MLKKKGMIELFGKSNGLRIILAKLFKKAKEGIGLAIIPVDDLVIQSDETKSYFIHPLKPDYTKNEYMGILNLNLSSKAIKANLYADDILTNKNDPNDVEKVIEVDRGVPMEGVMTLYLESMSKLTGIYSTMEAILREVFTQNSSQSNSNKYKVSLYFEFMEHIPKTDSMEDVEGDYLVFKPFTHIIDSQTVESKIQMFRFIELQVSKTHLLNEWKHIPLNLSSEHSPLFINSTVTVSLYLECTSEFEEDKAVRRLCGQTNISMNSVFSAQNQEGYKSSYGLVSDSREVICYLNCTLNYSKGQFERGDAVVQDIRRDLQDRLKDIKNLRIIVRLSEIISNRPLSKAVIPNQVKTRQSKANSYYLIKASLGKTEVRTIEVPIPMLAEGLMRLQMVNSDNIEDMVFSIDFAEMEDVLLEISNLEKFHNSRVASDELSGIPPLEIHLVLRDLAEEETVDIGRFQIHLGELIQEKVKATNSKMVIHSAYLPIQNKWQKERRNAQDVARLGLDICFLKKDKISNKNTLKDLEKLLKTSDIIFFEKLAFNFRMEDHGEQKRRLDGTPIYEFSQVHKLIKSILEISSSEASEIVDIIGYMDEDSRDLNISSLFIQPLMYSLESSFNQVNLKNANIDEIIKEFEFLDMEGTGHIQYNDVLKVYNSMTSQVQNLKRKQLDKFTFNSLVGSANCLVAKARYLENRFDYYVFLSLLFSKYVTYDMADVKYKSKFDKIGRDMEMVEQLKNKIEGGSIADSKPIMNSIAGYRLGMDSAVDIVMPRTSGQESLVEHQWKSNRNSIGNHPEEDVKLNYYDTWNNGEWKKTTNESPERVSYNQDGNISARGSIERNNPNKQFELTISLERAERLITVVQNKLPNCKANVKLKIFIPDHGIYEEKEYYSDTIPRSSNPEWNFDIKFTFHDLERFYFKNYNAELYVQLMDVDHNLNDPSSSISVNVITSFSGFIFKDFSEDDIQKLLRSDDYTITKQIVWSKPEGLKVYLSTQLRSEASTTTYENPFRNALMEQEENDFKMDSISRTKKTIDEIKGIPADTRYNLIDNQTIENLKNTLSSSDMFKANTSKISRPRTSEDNNYSHKPRMSEAINPTFAHSQLERIAEEPGVGFGTINPQNELMPGKYGKNNDYDYQVKTRGSVEGQRDGHNSRGASQDREESEANRGSNSSNDPFKAIGRLRDRYNQVQQKLMGENIIDTEEKNNTEMRPTPNFAGEAPNFRESVENDSASNNPYRGNQLMSDDANKKSQELPLKESSGPTTGKGVDRLMRGLREKLPGGGLREEDLERIERIFKNPKFGSKLLDFEDSDLDY